ncbi:hypothetical protein PsYK624_164640 [Phanerochaete sordida]|uniref:Uncharacterized protein n=1 Tax=Phanerochaete sordida TaxID=48140 RepID=A0A9P3GT97_9APHY|nr:hypothetical protein PsYK624_164640 [Phanerochaete sordida]
MVSSPSSTSPDSLPSLQTPLATYQSLLHLLAEHTSVPHPTPLHLSDSLDIVPYAYLILSCPPGVPLSELRRHGKLSERDDALIDLSIGRWMREMRDRVQNDWFGQPKAPSAARSLPPSLPGLPGFFTTSADEPSYSWQETFTALLEAHLAAAETRGTLPPAGAAKLRAALARAIGSFLFDDCAAPSLLSFTGDAGSVYVALPPPVSSPDAVPREPRITALLPPACALWGDPLLETFFLRGGPEDGTGGRAGPSQALIEGYGGDPVVFARQRTKRVWYDVFLALAVLLAPRDDTADGPDGSECAAHEAWARRRLAECVEVLKDAPCY